ncbi:hypothetical protein PCE1_004762 [Barthelona sp. PCE]
MNLRISDALGQKVLGRGPIDYHWSPRMNYAAVNCMGSKVLIIDINLNVVASIRLSKTLLSIKWSNKSEAVAIVDEGATTVTIVDIFNNRKIYTVNTQFNSREVVSCLAWNRHGVLAICGNKGSVFLHNFALKQNQLCPNASTKGILEAQWTIIEEEDFIVMIAQDDSIVVVDQSCAISKVFPVGTGMRHLRVVRTQRASLGETTCCCILDDGELFLLNLQGTNEAPWELSFREAYGRLVSFCWFGNSYLCLNFSKGYVSILSTHEAEVTSEIAAHQLAKTAAKQVSYSERDGLLCVAYKEKYFFLNTKKNYQVFAVNDIRSFRTALKQLKSKDALHRQIGPKINFWRTEFQQDGKFFTVSNSDGMLVLFTNRSFSLIANYSSYWAHLVTQNQVRIVNLSMLEADSLIPNHTFLKIPDHEFPDDEIAKESVIVTLSHEPTMMAMSETLLVTYNNGRIFAYMLDLYSRSEEQEINMVIDREVVGNIKSIHAYNDWVGVVMVDSILLLNVTNEDEIWIPDMETGASMSEVVYFEFQAGIALYVTKTGFLCMYALESRLPVVEYQHTTGIRLAAFRDTLGCIFIDEDDKLHMFDGLTSNVTNSGIVPSSVSRLFVDSYFPQLIALYSSKDAVIYPYLFSRNTVTNDPLISLHETRVIDADEITNSLLDVHTEIFSDVAKAIWMEEPVEEKIPNTPIMLCGSRFYFLHGSRIVSFSHPAFDGVFDIINQREPLESMLLTRRNVGVLDQQWLDVQFMKLLNLNFFNYAFELLSFYSALVEESWFDKHLKNDYEFEYVKDELKQKVRYFYFLFALRCLFCLELRDALVAFTIIGNASLVQHLSAIDNVVSDYHLLRGYVFCLFSELSLGQQAFISSSCPMEALNMRIDICDYKAAITLAKSLNPDWLPFLNRELALTLEFDGKYREAAQCYKQGLDAQATEEERKNVRRGEIRCNLRIGNLHKYDEILAMKDPGLNEQCGQILEDMSQHKDAATFYVHTQNNHCIKRALDILLEYGEVDLIRDLNLFQRFPSFLTSISIVNKYCDLLIEKKQYQAAYDAYSLINDYGKMVSLLFNVFNRPESAFELVQASQDFEAARTAIEYYRRNSDYEKAIIFMLMVRQKSEAFELAKTHGLIDIFVENLSEDLSREEYLALAEHFKSQDKIVECAMFTRKAGEYFSALSMYLANDMVPEAIELVAEVENEFLTKQLYAYLIGKEDGQLKNPTHLFHFYLALNDIKSALGMATKISSHGLRNGNPHHSKEILVSCVLALNRAKNQTSIPVSIFNQLFFVHFTSCIETIETLQQMEDMSSVLKKRLEFALVVAWLSFVEHESFHLLPVVAQLRAMIETATVCNSIGLKEEAFEYGTKVLNHPSHSELTQADMTSAARIVRRGRRKGKITLPPQFCPFCKAQNVAFATECHSCLSYIPRSLVTGSIIGFEGVKVCPHCNCAGEAVFMDRMLMREAACPLCSEDLKPSEALDLQGEELEEHFTRIYGIVEEAEFFDDFDDEFDDDF